MGNILDRDTILYDTGPPPANVAHAAKLAAKAAPAIDLPDTDDLIALASAAIPALVRRAVLLAHESESLGQVTAVLTALADRVHGKPAQSMAISGGVVVENKIGESDREIINRYLAQNAAAVTILPVVAESQTGGAEHD